MNPEPKDESTKDPGWSNSLPAPPPEPPADPINMHEPGWSNAESEAPPAVDATGATAGTPGTWTPAGAKGAADLAAMAAITASPVTAWTTGQHMALNDATHAHWTGTAWFAGDAV